jgi:preprotein translocase subunit SecB
LGKGNVKDYTLYTLSFRQSGIFILKGYEEEEIDEILLIDCPHILMPYARLHTSNLTAQTGFSPAIIQEINFKEVYESQNPKP